MLSGLNEVLALPVLQQRPRLKLHSRNAPRLTGQRVMITGAGGSIGSELVRQVAEHSPSAMILIDHHEFNLYDVAQTLAENEVDFPVETLLIDLRDVRVIQEHILDAMPDTVLHAAAYKHVPLLENPVNAFEALRVNVVGTAAVTAAASELAAPCIVISTDKAASPLSFMGLTKRLAEITALHIAGHEGQESLVRAVRFGNVLGSSGSVLPLFRRQIAQGGPITVTDPDMERFFMSIREACDLVLSAASMNGATPNGVFMLDMGSPVKIIDLARQLLREAGLREDKDIEIKITGMRPGEKLKEVLLGDDETARPTPVKEITQCALNGELPDPSMLLTAIIERDLQRVRAEALTLVPSYGGEWPL